MKYAKDPTERTTAITDIILALAAFGGILMLSWNPAPGNAPWKIIIWSAAFGLIGLAAALGAAAHGLRISRTVHVRIWQLLNLALALAVSLFVAGVVYDLWGPAVCFKVLPATLAAGLGFFGVTLRYAGIFFVFIVYEGLALLFALSAYVYLAVRGAPAGAAFMAAGILVREGSLVAAAAGAALPGTLPQLIFVLLMLGVGILLGRASRPTRSAQADGFVYFGGDGI